MSLAMANALFFSSPFFISILATIFLKEKVGIRRWIAIFAGFFGVYIVLNPDFNDFNIYSLFPILCAFFYALTVVIQKKTSDKDSLFTQIIHTYLSAILFSIIIYFVIQNITFTSYQVSEYKFLLMSWQIPSLYFLFILLIIGFTGVIGFFSLFGAYRIGSPSTIAPYEYSLIIWSILFGYFIWNDYLTITGFVGLSLILIASFFTLYREYQLNIKVNLDKPIR